MNWDQVQGKWKQMRGSVKQKWGKLTDNDLEYMEGGRDHFIGKLQERYGIAKEDAQNQVDQWLNTFGETDKQKAGSPPRETQHTGSAR